MALKEPEIQSDGILRLQDPAFHAGNVCMVSGCGTGIGRACAVAAAANRLMVVGLDIDSRESKKTLQLARRMGGQMIFLPTDLADDAEIQSAVAEASRLGTIKYLLNIAGIQHIDVLENFPMETYDRIQRIMLRAPFFLSRLVIPHMHKSHDGCGVIGNMAFGLAHICTRDKPAFNMTKFGLHGLAQSISAEGEGKIRAFTLSTGLERISLASDQLPLPAAQPDLSAEEVVHGVMMGSSRIKERISPMEVANLFIIGLSRHSRYLVAGELLFDGGMVATY